jgi:nicotinamidase/pyrazinamidase
MKNIHLVVIDPQRDFCLPDGALFVQGANEDMERLAGLITRVGAKLTDIHVTLDSHQYVHIAHPIFWKDRKGNHPNPFTLINVADVENGTYRATAPSLQGYALKYVRTLEQNKRYVLCIWPPHCIIGTPGQTLHPAIADALRVWSEKNFGYPDFVTKGSNILTEHYSAVVADVPDAEDLSTQLNTRFIETINEADLVLFAGEASSHCVANTLRDMVNYFADDSLVKKIVYLQDASSPVTGFEQMEKDFVQEMRSRGMQFTTTKDFLA